MQTGGPDNTAHRSDQVIMFEANTLFCLCGRSFTLEYAHSNHQRQCKKTKKRLSSALEKAKEIWNTKKRRRIEELSLPIDDQAIEVASLAANVSFIHTTQGR